MKALRVEDVRQAVHGRWFTRPVETLVKGVSTDTRTARREDLFVALLGDRFDGHAFLPEAHEAGCPAAIIRIDHSERLARIRSSASEQTVDFRPLCGARSLP